MSFGKTEELLMDKQGMKGILGKDNNRCKAKSMQKHSIRKTKLFSMVGVG